MVNASFRDLGRTDSYVPPIVPIVSFQKKKEINKKKKKIKQTIHLYFRSKQELPLSISPLINFSHSLWFGSITISQASPSWKG